MNITENYLKELNAERFELIAEVVTLRRQRLVLTMALVLLISSLFAGCSTVDYLAVAQECGNGPECQEQWDVWNEVEDRKAEKERQRELKAYRQSVCRSEDKMLVTFPHSKDWSCISERELRGARR